MSFCHAFFLFPACLSVMPFSDSHHVFLSCLFLIPSMSFLSCLFPISSMSFCHASHEPRPLCCAVLCCAVLCCAVLCTCCLNNFTCFGQPTSLIDFCMQLVNPTGCRNTSGQVCCIAIAACNAVQQLAGYFIQPWPASNDRTCAPHVHQFWHVSGRC